MAMVARIWWWGRSENRPIQGALLWCGWVLGVECFGWRGWCRPHRLQALVITLGTRCGLVGVWGEGCGRFVWAGMGEVGEVGRCG